MTSSKAEEALHYLDKALDPETPDPWMYVDDARDVLASEVDDA